MKKIKKLGIVFFAAIKKNLPRILPVVIMIIFYSLPVLAQTDPFASAETSMTKYLGSVKKLLYLIAAIIALVGAFNCYHKMINGDQDVKKTIMLTLGGCIAMIALSEALPAFFGHTA